MSDGDFATRMLTVITNIIVVRDKLFSNLDDADLMESVSFSSIEERLIPSSCKFGVGVVSKKIGMDWYMADTGGKFGNKCLKYIWIFC